VQALRNAIGSQLVEIHGQHDDRALVDPATHRALLDAFGGLDDRVQAVASACTPPWRNAAETRAPKRAHRSRAQGSGFPAPRA
jgi:DNA repair protein RecN (Recombination protein N)